MSQPGPSHGTFRPLTSRDLKDLEKALADAVRKGKLSPGEAGSIGKQANKQYENPIYTPEKK